MSVQGTVLILDGVSTNRIMLNVQLSSACYQVMQRDRVEGLEAILHHTRPDLILMAESLPDGNVSSVKELLNKRRNLSNTPVVAITPQNDRKARKRALLSGADDVLVQPYNDNLLLARVRSFMRLRSEIDDLDWSGESTEFGFGEAASPFQPQIQSASVAIVTATKEIRRDWLRRLQPHTPYSLGSFTLGQAFMLFRKPAPDIFVLQVSKDGEGLNLLTELRARLATRHSAVVAVVEDDNVARAVEAYDRGADVVFTGPFCAEELALHLKTQAERKSRRDRRRASVQEDLKAANFDHLTGLRNSRYAQSALRNMVRSACKKRRNLSVIIVDLDHFKTVNDRFGHLAGDRVLSETARRIRQELRPEDLVARLGGEEFLVALPDTGPDKAMEVAKNLRRRISDTPYHLPMSIEAVTVTASFGLHTSETATCSDGLEGDEISALIDTADRALYTAKNAGRNRVFRL